MANVKVLKEVEKRLASRYNSIRANHRIDAIGTAVHEFIAYIEATPILKDMASALLLFEDGPSYEEWVAARRGRLEPPIERNKKARLCYEMLSGWYWDIKEEKGNLADRVQNVGHSISFERNIADCMMAYTDSFITPLYEYLDEELEELIKDEEVKDEDVAEPNPENIRKVFVVHGRDIETLGTVLDFLKANGLEPLTFDDARMLVDEAAPSLLRVVDKGMEEAWAVLVLITPDDVGKLKGDPVEELSERPRENVVFEGGLAFGRYRKRTVLVEHEIASIFSDLHGHYVVRLRRGDDGIEGLEDILKQLRVAGCKFGLDEN